MWSVRARVKSKPTEYFPVTISCDVYSLSAGRQRRRRQSQVNKVDRWIIQDQRRSSARPPRLYCLETTSAAGLKGTFEDEKKKKQQQKKTGGVTLNAQTPPKCETGDRRRCRLVWSLLPFLMKHKCLETSRWLCATNTSPHSGVAEWISLCLPLAGVEYMTALKWQWIDPDKRRKFPSYINYCWTPKVLRIGRGVTAMHLCYWWDTLQFEIHCLPLFFRRLIKLDFISTNSLHFSSSIKRVWEPNFYFLIF